MNRTCSWCGKEYKEADADGHAPGAMAGAVCDECARALLAECGVELKRYLDGLGSPIMLVDPEGVVVAASQDSSGRTHGPSSDRGATWGGGPELDGQLNA